MNSLLVDDNIIDLNDQLEIKTLLVNNWFPWYISESVNKTCSQEELDHFSKFIPCISENLQFVHSFIANGKNNSDYTENVIKPLYKFCEKHKISLKKIHRIKANFCPQIVENRDIYFHCPHVDSSQNHFVLIYYVNNSDGDTYIFNEILKDENDTFFDCNKISLKQTVKPLQGRFLFFQGNQFHAGSHPKTSNMRIVINYNFEIEP